MRANDAAYLFVLIRSYSNKLCFWEIESEEGLVSQGVDVACFDEVDPRLISMHRVEYDLQENTQ